MFVDEALEKDGREPAVTALLNALDPAVRASLRLVPVPSTAASAAPAVAGPAVPELQPAELPQFPAPPAVRLESGIAGQTAGQEAAAPPPGWQSGGSQSGGREAGGLAGPRGGGVPGDTQGRGSWRGFMARQVLLVEPGRAGAFGSVGEALAEAREGALISLAAGRYEESVVITQAVTLAAAGEPGSAQLHSVGGSAVVVEAGAVRLSGLSVSGCDPLAPVIDVRRGQAALEGCTVSGQGSAAVLAQLDGSVAVRGCQVAGLSGAGVVVTSAGMNVVEGSSVDGTGSSAVVVSGAGVLTVRDCEMGGPGGNGICVTGQGRVVVEDTMVSGSGAPALAVEEDAGAEVSGLMVAGGAGVDAYLAGTGPVTLNGCSFTGAAQQSVHVAGGAPVLRGCVLSPAGGAGLYATGAARPRVVDCEITGALAAVTADAASSAERTWDAIRDAQADLLLTRGATMTPEELAAASEGHGITASDGAQVTVSTTVLRGCGIVAGFDAVVTAEDTEIAAAPHDGILLLPGATLTAVGCRVHGAGRYGLDIRDGATAALTSCIIDDDIRHAPGALTRGRPFDITGSSDHDLGTDLDPDAFAGLVSAVHRVTSAAADEAATTDPLPLADGSLAEAADAFPRPDPAVWPGAAALVGARREAAGTPAGVPGRRNPRIRVPKRAGQVAAVALTCLIVVLSAPLWVRHMTAQTRALPTPQPSLTQIALPSRPVVSSMRASHGEPTRREAVPTPSRMPSPTPSPTPSPSQRRTVTEPAVPAGLTVTSTTGSSISLSWTESSNGDPAAAYKVYEGGTVVAAPTSSTATITGLAPNSGHTYTVTAIDSAGKQSAFSASVDTTTASPIGRITGFEGQCLDDKMSGTTDFNPIQVFTCNGTNAQQWTVAPGNRLVVFGMCLDVDAAGTADGTLVDLFTCNGTGAQEWVPQSNGELVNPNSGKCLDDTGYGGSGTQVQIWSCADTSNQQWVVP